MKKKSIRKNLYKVLSKDKDGRLWSAMLYNRGVEYFVGKPSRCVDSYGIFTFSTKIVAKCFANNYLANNGYKFVIYKGTGINADSRQREVQTLYTDEVNLAMDGGVPLKLIVDALARTDWIACTLSIYHKDIEYKFLIGCHRAVLCDKFIPEKIVWSEE